MNGIVWVTSGYRAELSLITSVDCLKREVVVSHLSGGEVNVHTWYRLRSVYGVVAPLACENDELESNLQRLQASVLEKPSVFAEGQCSRRK